MSEQDCIELSRGQRIDIFDQANRFPRLIVDHPLNAPLLGLQGGPEVRRSAEFILQGNDRAIALFFAGAGVSVRVATARIARRKGGALCLTQWKLASGFGLQSDRRRGRVVHRVLKTVYHEVGQPASANRAIEKRCAAT